MTKVELRVDLIVEVGHVAGKFASAAELREHVCDLLVEVLEDMDDAEVETYEGAEYRVERTHYRFSDGKA